jgi:hypothetical protein
MYQTKDAEKIKTHNSCSVTPPPLENRAVYEMMWKNTVQWEQAADNTAHAHCMLGN